uniref:HAT C-terminal dimerisation domain-containing protein n=1 Tax=Maylandia zebra TaxID=106582 RepID=A0A3P9C291_9CICH
MTQASATAMVARVSTIENMEQGIEYDRAAFTTWKYRHYFEFDSLKSDKNISVRCTLCIGRKLLSTSKNSTSNLSKHLARCHKNVKLTENPQDPLTDVTAVKLDVRATGLSAAELKKLVAAYIVEDMLPISTVDSESFRRIVEKIPTKSGVKLPQRKSFVGYLEREYDKMNSNLKATLEEAEFVSTTADIWTVNNKSFMGVTVHWINSTLQHNKAALACKRIRGSHTYDVIGAEIEEIHSSYGLQGKVVATVTDNASNFAKAFRVCQPCHLESESENEEGDDEEPTFTDVIEALSAASGDAQFSLPPHYRCASHTINLISTSDVDKHLNSCADTKAVYRSSIAKCSALWTKASRSTLASEQVEEVSRRKLMVPTSTRWNSLYEAISRIITIPLNELNPLCVKLGIKCLNEREYQFLKEYCTVMKPLTVALDILQGDECTYRALLPTLTSLIKIILFLVASYCMLQAIKTRFDAVLDSQEGLLAAATCPKFKLRWLRDERRREYVKELLITECRKAAPATENTNVSQIPASPAEMDFFEFQNQPTESFSAEKEITDFLRSGYELEILNQFPNLKKMYMKYNSPTPSSAPVERLFSLGGLVLSPKRNRMSDRRFEKLLLMRYNHCFSPKENNKT